MVLQSFHERRLQRSAVVSEAVELYLNAVRSRGLVESVALGDRLGLLVAGVGERSTLELLAVVGVLRPEDRERYQREIERIAVAGHCESLSLDLDGEHYTVTAITKNGFSRSEITASLERIVSAGRLRNVAS
jgi:hypothetical protein